MKQTYVSRRDFLKVSAFSVITGAMVPSCTKAKILKAGRKPNFIIIFTDDQGYQDVGCFGSPNIRTPNLDGMASEGMKFTDFYVAAPVCSPSRAALMTGCYPLRVSLPNVLRPQSKTGLNPNEITIAEILKKQGYATACVGKWHLGDRREFLPTRQGFDSYFGVPYSNDMPLIYPEGGKPERLDEAWRLRKEALSWWNPSLMRNEEVVERPADQTTLADRYTEEAVKIITANKDRPFFLYLAHNLVHTPLFVSDKHYVKDPQQAYQAAVEQVDESAGKILQTLKATGIDQHTLVIFTSDNGPWLIKKHHGGSALPLRDGKGTTYEGGMREPCIMRWPGHIPAGQVCREVTSTIDILPTFAGLVGAAAPTDRIIDGKDIWPLMAAQKEAKSPHDAFFYYKANELQAVRAGKWKLKLPEELYNLESDISESKNMADQHPKIVKKLKKLMQDFDRDLKAQARPAGVCEVIR